MLGDSLTQGYGLTPETGFVPQLQRWLVAHGSDAVLVNAGVSGDTTHGGFARIGWTLTPDVDGLVVALGANDVLRGIDPAAARDNLTGILQAAQDAGVDVLLAGLTTPGNFGPEYKRDFDAIYPELSAQFGTLYAPEFLAGLAEAVENGAPLQELLQGDRLHPNAKGVTLNVEAFGPIVLQLIERVSAGD